jgi:hypothetical protein
VLEALTTEQCREHLGGGGVGRFLFIEPGRGPVAILVVLLSGTARIITDPAELAHAAALGIEPWAAGDRDVYVRMSASQVTGRRIRVDG